MSKSFKQVLMDIVGRDLECKGFELASSKCHQGYPVYHRKSDSFLEIIQFGKDKYESKLIVSCSIVYLGVDEEKSNIHYPSFLEFSGGDLAKISTDDCKEIFYLKGHNGNCFYFGDVYLAFGAGIVAVTEGAKKPFGIIIKRCKAGMYEKVAKLILKRLESAHIWLASKRAVRPIIPYQRVVEIMENKQLDFDDNYLVHAVIYSKTRDIRYVIVYEQSKEIFTYSLQRIDIYDEEEWGFVCHRYDALPAYWSAMKEAGGSLFGTFDEVMNEIKSDPIYLDSFV